MNITKYRLELDENRHNILVRESDTEYGGENFNDPLAVAEMLKSNRAEKEEPQGEGEKTVDHYHDWRHAKK